MIQLERVIKVLYKPVLDKTVKDLMDYNEKYSGINLYNEPATYDVVDFIVKRVIANICEEIIYMGANQ